MTGCSTPEHSTGKVILTENCLCSPEQTLQGARGARLVQQPLQGLLWALQQEQPKRPQRGTNLPQKRLCSLGKVTECLKCGKLPSVPQHLHHHRPREAQALERLSSVWSHSSGIEEWLAPQLLWVLDAFLHSHFPVELFTAWGDSGQHTTMIKKVHGVLTQLQFPRSLGGIAVEPFLGVTSPWTAWISLICQPLVFFL